MAEGMMRSPGQIADPRLQYIDRALRWLLSGFPAVERDKIPAQVAQYNVGTVTDGTVERDLRIGVGGGMTHAGLPDRLHVDASATTAGARENPARSGYTIEFHSSYDMASGARKDSSVALYEYGKGNGNGGFLASIPLALSREPGTLDNDLSTLGLLGGETAPTLVDVESYASFSPAQLDKMLNPVVNALTLTLAEAGHPELALDQQPVS